MLGKRDTEMDTEPTTAPENLPTDQTQTKKLKTGEEGPTAILEEYNPLKYRIKKEIGQGTFGVVFKAKNTYMNTIVAIKKTAQDPRNTNREFLILVKLDHPNCLKLISYYFTKEPQSAGPKVPTKSEIENPDVVSPDSESKADEPKIDFLNLVTPYYNQDMYAIMNFYRKMSKKNPGKKAGLPNTLVQLYSY